MRVQPTHLSSSLSLPLPLLSPSSPSPIVFCAPPSWQRRIHDTPHKKRHDEARAGGYESDCIQIAFQGRPREAGTWPTQKPAAMQRGLVEHEANLMTVTGLARVCNGEQTIPTKLSCNAHGCIPHMFMFLTCAHTTACLHMQPVLPLCPSSHPAATTSPRTASPRLVLLHATCCLSDVLLIDSSPSHTATQRHR